MAKEGSLRLFSLQCNLRAVIASLKSICILDALLVTERHVFCCRNLKHQNRNGGGAVYTTVIVCVFVCGCVGRGDL